MLITPCLKEVKTTVVYPWFATTKQGGHVGGQYNRIFSHRIYMKIEFSSRRRVMLLLLATNNSHPDVTCKQAAA